MSRSKTAFLAYLTIAFTADGDMGIGQSNTDDYLMLVDPTGKVFDSLSYDDDDTMS